MKQNKNISLAKKGMNRDIASDSLENQSYTFAKNMNVENDSGNLLKLKSEHSNLLASKFVSGYKVVGFETDINTGSTYFFLTNPETNVSEIGVILNNSNFDLMSDVESECEECEFKRILNQPLENTTQSEYLNYKTILEDSCNNCLNFDIKYPIKKVIIKNEKSGLKIFFSDNLNPPRYVNLNKLNDYKFTGVEVCDDDSNVESTCLACDKLRMFPIYEPINLEPKGLIVGGNLPQAQYSFYIAHSNKLGEEMSEYSSLTNPVSVFDPNNRILNNEEKGEPTNYAIKLKVDNVDPAFSYYKIVVSVSNIVNGATRHYIVGNFPSNTEDILFSSIQDKEETTLSNILIPNPNIKLLEGLATSNNYLFGYGVTKEKEWNLQPVVNLMGGFFKWQTHVAKEDLYEDGVNNSLYKSYMRDEVYPLSIQLETNFGYRTARFPLISRPASSTDREVVNNLDSQSIQAGIDTCVGTERNERWEIYNTATEIGTCSAEVTAGNFEVGTRYAITFIGDTDFTAIGASSNTVGEIFTATGAGVGTGTAEIEIQVSTVIEPVTKTCTIPNVVTAPADTFVINNVEEFTNLEDYINDSIEQGSCPTNVTASFCSLIDPADYADCDPEFENCQTPELVEEFLRIESISNENEHITYITFPDDYSKLTLSGPCNPHRRDGTGGFVVDTEFMSQYIESGAPSNNQRAFERVESSYNTSATYAEELNLNPTGNLQVTTGYHHNFSGYTDTTLPDALTDAQLTSFDAPCTDSGQFDILNAGFSNTTYNWQFSSKVHKDSLWYKINQDTLDNSFILELTKLVPDEISKTIVNYNARVRVTIFTSTAGGTPLFCNAVSLLNNGTQVLVDIDVDADTLVITGDNLPASTPVSIPNNLYIAVDVPLVESEGDTLGYFSLPTRGCFGVTLREKEIDFIEASYDSIVFEKVQKYVANCSFEVPIVPDCGVVPYKYGEFSFWESSINYPDNKELYDSSELEVNTSDFHSIEVADEFESKYATTKDLEGNFTLSEETNFTCQPIRHFKFPDNSVSPFMYQNEQSGFAKSIIYPIGVTIDENVINDFLDIAVKNNLITQEQRDSIVGYEIFRGDRTLNKGVIAKGLAYDMYSYEEQEKSVLFSNFPYNSLGNNELFYTDDSRQNSIPHPFNSDSNYNFSFHSPDTEYYKPTIPTELKIEGYAFGKSKGVFDEVEEHAKYVILGREARRLASTLATAELIAEAVIGAAQAFSNIKLDAGFSTTVFHGGFIGSPIILAFQAIGDAVFKYGRYKYQWIETFRNLGSPENFAYYYTSVGDYNFLKPLQSEGETVRSILNSNYIPSGRFTVINEVDGEKQNINNVDREQSVFLSTGAGFPISYPADYKNYDNYNEGRDFSSRFTQSTTLDCSKGRSKEFIKNIASPYVALKSFIPDQYGSIDNVDWLTTSYRGDLKNPDNSCLKIYGGDTFISRHTLKRKIPMFLTNGMDLADRTPFNYRAYSNIGENPKYYANFLSPDELEIDRGLPDIRSEHSFDCVEGTRDFYVKSPSKFYLFYYGIPSFLTETTINTNYRTGKPQQKDLFYPLVGDYVDWTQEKNVSIKERNEYFYSPIYSSNTRVSIGRKLPATYDKETYDSLYDAPNGVIYSVGDNNENELTEPWLVFRPLDKYEFSSSYGKLIELRGIETSQMLARFENQSAIFNAVDVLVDGITADTADLGTGGIFARRPVTFADTDLGYAGSQSFDMVSCEYGHFFPDAKRGQVFQVPPGGKGMMEISSNINGQPSGMKNWFKEHLPFKILNNKIEGYQDIDVDNPYNGLGISMGWDSRYKRVFITKKDYKPLKPLKWACDGFYDTNLDVYEETINEYEGNGFTFDGIVDCRLNFSKPGIPTSTDIYAFFDTTSMQQDDGVDAAAALNSWFSSYQTLNPEYTGNLYIIPYSNERWAAYPSFLVTGNINPTGFGLWSSIAQLPPNLNTGDWVAPTDLIVLAFVDESNNEYHGSSVTGGFTSSGVNQPTSSFTNDYNQFVIDYQNFNYFKGVVYPIVQSTTGVGGALVLQALAAIEGTTLTNQEITDLNTNVDVSILTSENPYSSLGGLKEYNWKGVYDKESPASAVFNSNTFNQEIDELLIQSEDNIVETAPLNEVQLTDSEFFEDVSWTVAYSLTTQSWISYYDFKPNYYVNHNNYFQTGINVTNDDSEFGLWSHLLTNKSFGVFYGKKYEVGLEFPTINNFTSKQLESLEIWTEALRYHNDYDFAYHRDINFNKLVVSNHRETTGNLRLIPQKSLSQIRSYPKTYSGYQEILMTNSQDRWKINYLFNRVSSEDLNQPIWNWDTNQIDKTINNRLVKFKGKRVLERLRGNFFLNYLGYDLDTRFEVSFKWAISDENLT